LTSPWASQSERWCTWSVASFSPSANYSTIGGGAGNVVWSSTQHSTVAGGSSNLIKSGYGAVAGGQDNSVSTNASHCAIGGGYSNEIVNGAFYSVIAGGQNNTLGDNAHCASMGGGLNNSIAQAAGYAVIAGGSSNSIGYNASRCSIGGGNSNEVKGSSPGGTIGGGLENTVGSLSLDATIGGGYKNSATGDYAAVGGGCDNIAGGESATVAGGRYNEASGTYATVPGGRKNRAVNYSLAAGYRARAAHKGCFVWADRAEANLLTTANDQFLARARGGFKFFTNAAMTSGARLNPGSGSWTSLSDRECKKNFELVDAREVLERLAEVPVRTWSYKSQDDSIRHMGATSQDLHAAFGLGVDDKGIATVDGMGISMAAIQGLNEKIEEKDTRIARLENELADLKALVAQMAAKTSEP
jgi:hypothetical protein